MIVKMVALLLILVSVLASPAAVWAQQAREVKAEAWDSVMSVEQGDELAVKLRSGKNIKGKQSAVTANTLTLAKGQQPVVINREDVYQVYRIVGKSHGKGALTGAAIGGTIGAVGGFGCSDETACFSPLVAVVGAAFLGGIGALVGLAASGGHKRVLIYQAQ